MLTLTATLFIISALLLIALYYHVIDTFMRPVEGDEEHNL